MGLQVVDLVECKESATRSTHAQTEKKEKKPKSKSFFFFCHLYPAPSIMHDKGFLLI